MPAVDSFVGDGLNPSPYKEALARAERAEAERDALRALLRQLRGWDVLHSSHDGKYWREEIDAALGERDE